MSERDPELIDDEDEFADDVDDEECPNCGEHILYCLCDGEEDTDDGHDEYFDDYPL